MIDHTLLKPAGAVVLAGAAAAALTVGQSAFAVGKATARAHTTPAACKVSGPWLRAAAAPLMSRPGCHAGARHRAPGRSAT